MCWSHSSGSFLIGASSGASIRFDVDFTLEWAQPASSSGPPGIVIVQRPRAIPLRLDANPLGSDRDHDAFALWVLSSSERAVFNSSCECRKRDGRCCILGMVATGLQPVTSGM